MNLLGYTFHRLPLGRGIMDTLFFKNFISFQLDDIIHRVKLPMFSARSIHVIMLWVLWNVEDYIVLVLCCWSVVVSLCVVVWLFKKSLVGVVKEVDGWMEKRCWQVNERRRWRSFKKSLSTLRNLFPCLASAKDNECQAIKSGFVYFPFLPFG